MLHLHVFVVLAKDNKYIWVNVVQVGLTYIDCSDKLLNNLLLTIFSFYFPFLFCFDKTRFEKSVYFKIEVACLYRVPLL